MNKQRNENSPFQKQFYQFHLYFLLTRSDILVNKLEYNSNNVVTKTIVIYAFTLLLVFLYVLDNTTHIQHISPNQLLSLLVITMLTNSSYSNFCHLQYYRIHFQSPSHLMICIVMTKFTTNDIPFINEC